MKLFLTIVAAILVAAAIIAGAYQLWSAKKARDEQAASEQVKADFDKITAELKTASSTNSPPAP